LKKSGRQLLWADREQKNARKVPCELGKDLQTKETRRFRSNKSKNSESSFADEESV
jgi:hypothetical protein